MLALGLIAATWVLTLLYYPALPDQIPTHFNAHGTVDSYGPKITLFILPTLSLCFVLGLLYLTKIPHRFNYLVNITPENAASEYLFARQILRYASVGIGLLFLEICWEIVRAVSGGPTQLSLLFWVIFMADMIALPALVLSRKKEKVQV